MPKSKKQRLPKFYVNKSLSSPDGKIYNASYLDHNILLSPVRQRPSNALTYTWRFTFQSHWFDSACFDSANQALADAVSLIDSHANHPYRSKTRP